MRTTPAPLPRHRHPGHRLRVALGVTLLAIVAGAFLVSPSLATSSPHQAPSREGLQLARAATGPAEDTVPVTRPSSAPATPMPATPTPATPTPATPTPAPPAPATVTLDPLTGPAPCRKGLVALTFDDGPARHTTERLIATLQDKRVPATFFMVGSRVATAPRAARAVQAAGFGIGNHTWDHADLARLRGRQILDELNRTAAELRRAGVTPGPLMRPPYGAVNKRVRNAAKAKGLTPVLWNVDSNDWRGAPRGQIWRSVLHQLVPHRANVVLQHDGVRNSPASVAAVPRIVSEARRRGYCFAGLGSNGRPHSPVPELVATATTGTESGAPALIRLTLSQPTDRPVSVHLSTPVSAPLLGVATPGTDVATVDAVVNFPAGSRGATVSIPLAADGQPEGEEKLAVQLDGADDLELTQSSVEVPVTDGP